MIGKEFELLTDHKPLEHIYATKSRPSPRMERCVLRMELFEYRIKYMLGKTNIADALSRLVKAKTTGINAEVDFVQWIAKKSSPRAISMKEI